MYSKTPRDQLLKTVFFLREGERGERKEKKYLGYFDACFYNKLS